MILRHIKPESVLWHGVYRVPYLFNDPSSTQHPILDNGVRPQQTDCGPLNNCSECSRGLPTCNLWTGSFPTCLTGVVELRYKKGLLENQDVLFTPPRRGQFIFGLLKYKLGTAEVTRLAKFSANGTQGWNNLTSETTAVGTTLSAESWSKDRIYYKICNFYFSCPSSKCLYFNQHGLLLFFLTSVCRMRCHVP